MAMLLVAASLVSSPGGWNLASEPGGALLFEQAWTAGAPGPGSESPLRIVVRPIVRLEDVALRVEAPPGIEVRDERGTVLSGRPPTPLGGLDAGRHLVINLSVRAPMEGGGIVSIRILARDGSGRDVSEGFGQPVGRVGVAPRLRDEALEFPAEAPTPPGGA